MAIAGRSKKLFTVLVVLSLLSDFYAVMYTADVCIFVDI